MITNGEWKRQGSTIIIDLGQRGDDGVEAELWQHEDTGGGRPVLQLGSRGSSVTSLQARLAQLGFSAGAIDGIFGPQTQAAVKRFQGARGLRADGIVRSDTWDKLDAAPSSAPVVSPAPGSGSGADRIVAEAARHVGYHEGPDNDNMFSAYFGVNHVPWCAYFVSYVHKKAGFEMAIGDCDAMLAKAMDENRFHTDVPRRGDVVFYDLSRSDGDSPDHVGIVESVTQGSRGEVMVNTIEGNTSDAVNRRVRTHGSSDIVGYGRFS